MKVIAQKGTKCPMEGKPREYITDSKAVDVPETSYYKRLINDGSLVLKDNRQKTETGK
jgi:hypothetical protein